MDDYLGRLRNELLKVMEMKEWNITQLSIACDISYHCMCNIVNGNVKDINFSTLIKIYENTNLSIAEVFNIEDSAILEKEIRKITMIAGKNRYRIQKI